MAGEITLNVRLEFSKGSTTHELGAQDLAIDVTGTAVMHQRMDIPTSETALELILATTGGYLVLINRDATNFVEMRPATGETDMVRIDAGEICCLRIPVGTAPLLIADTATCEVEYLLIEA